VRRHHDACAVGELGRPIGRRRLLPFDDRVGLDDLQRDSRRQLNATGRLEENRYVAASAGSVRLRIEVFLT
jgi:hypothetical protein